MKKSFKGFLACLLALIMVIPMFTVANADQMSTFNGTLQAAKPLPLMFPASGTAASI